MTSLIPNVGADFHFVYSCDLECHVQVKICTLDGALARLNYEDLLENPLLKFSGRNQAKYPDLMVETVVKLKENGLHLPVLTSFKSFTNRWEWNEWVKLPIKYSDLPRNAELHLTVFDCSGAYARTDVGSVSVLLFGKHGVFKEGQLDLRLTSRPSNFSSSYLTPTTNNFERLAKLTKDYHTGKIPQIDWLDRLTFAEIEKANQKEKVGSNQLFLMIEFPTVQFENKIHSVVFFEKNMNNVSEPLEPNALVKFQDPEIQMENLVEAKHYKLTRSQHASHSEKDLKPNATIRNRLNEIILYPSTQVLTNEEKDQIWQYRLYLSANKKALSKFVKVVNWNTPSEANSALTMVHKWAPMAPEDALELLGPSFTNQGVRKYAVSRLQQAPDEDLQLYLLQLVQALKYEKIESFNDEDKDGAHETDVKSLENMHSRNSQSFEQSLSQTETSSGCDEESEVSQVTVTHENLTGSPVSSGGLASFLIERASKNSVLANYFYWYLMTECENHEAVPQRDEKAQEIFELVLKRFKSVLKNGSSEFKERAEFLERQHLFVDKLVLLVRAVAKESGSRTKKIERLQTLLSDSDSFKYDFENFGPLQLPLDPSIQVCGIVASDASLFKSSLMPARITFVTANQLDQPYVTIFKHGDDLRQDQLILQIITLMDRILQQENLDLKLTPYRVLATSSKHGFVQFVDSLAIAEVLRSEGCIQNFFRKHNPSEGSPYGISADVMDTYVKSCAGYCVITYLLGVGDRHLDNLLLTKSGKLFHIDFGYILGRDPKPMPPPMKLSKEMIEAFGGVHSEHYHQFRRECFTAFLSLRRYANLILNLFSLMVDASVPDIALEPDKTVRKVQEKFRLEMNDEEAVHYMQSLIEVSATAVMAAIAERFHKLAQFLRN